MIYSLKAVPKLTKGLNQLFASVSQVWSGVWLDRELIWRAPLASTLQPTFSHYLMDKVSESWLLSEFSTCTFTTFVDWRSLPPTPAFCHELSDINLVASISISEKFLPDLCGILAWDLDSSPKHSVLSHFVNWHSQCWLSSSSNVEPFSILFEGCSLSLYVFLWSNERTIYVNISSSQSITFNVLHNSISFVIGYSLHWIHTQVQTVTLLRIAKGRLFPMKADIF